MAAKIWSNNIDKHLLKNYKFELFVAAIFVLICFWHASGLAFLLSSNFLFTQDQYISTRGFLTFSGDIEMWHWTEMG